MLHAAGQHICTHELRFDPLSAGGGMRSQCLCALASYL